MIECPRCATPNAPDARFCSNCGNSLVTRVGVQERRVVTALFADLARSTSLGEKLDPEVVRGMVGRFFELAAQEIERRGGTVEKFSGDAVMAVFGVPLAHEDDPERAVRAAMAIRDGVAAIAADTQQRHGVTLQARIGIESGEVVVGDPFGGATMATGDAMNTAARLEQQAEPTDIVIGEQAWEQLRGLVVAEPMGDLQLRGRDATVAGWRVTSIASEVGRPRGVPGLEAPLTGRDEELNMLLDAARRAQHERKASLFTILGVPGVGKSRLVREVTARLQDEGWSVVKGRCLPYGEGITYWPVAEMLRGMAGIEPDTSPADAQARLLAISPDADVCDRLATALGTHEAAESAQSATASGDREIAWAFRRLVEQRAATTPATTPQVLIFEDIHWAEPPMLDLIEYLVTWARDTPLLAICPARPELLDTRPAWGAGRMEASRISLEPLSEEESRSLLSALLTVDDLPASLRQRVLDRAEGNPLFVEEVVRMLIEEGIVERRDGRWHAGAQAVDVRVPDSIEALIRARLDTLPTPERVVLQAAAVVGRIFQQSAVAAISPEEETGQIGRHLDDAVLRDLITDERAPDEPTFRFRHVLIRDVAYTTLPKARRAELHRDVAAWLRDWAGPRIEEFVEIEAYHLEHAVALRRELDGRVDPTDSRRAIDALAACGTKALARDDARAALGFAERALALDPEPGEPRLELEWLQLESLRRLGDWRRAGELAAGVESRAAALGRRDIEGRAILAKGGGIWISLESADAQRALGEMRRAREKLTEAGDSWYLTIVLEFLGFEGWWYGNFDEAESVWNEEREVARANGWHSREAEALMLVSRISAQRGKVEVAGRQLSEARQLAEQGSSRLTRARVEVRFAGYLMLTRSMDEAEEVLLSAARTLEEFGDRDEQYMAMMHLGDIEARRDNWAESLAFGRRGFEHVSEHVGYRPEAQRRIARAMLELGDVEEAARIAEEAVAITSKDDWATQASTRMVLGLAREAQGRLDEAESLLREAQSTIGGTDYNAWDEELALAEFLLRQGRTTEGQELLARARASASRYGPESPLIEYVDFRAARAAGASTGTSAGQGAASPSD